MRTRSGIRTLVFLALLFLGPATLAERREGTRPTAREQARRLAAHMIEQRFRQLMGVDQKATITAAEVGKVFRVEEDAANRLADFMNGVSKAERNPTEFLRKFQAVEQDLYKNSDLREKAKLTELRNDIAKLTGENLSSTTRLAGLEIPRHIQLALGATRPGELLAAIDLEPTVALSLVPREAKSLYETYHGRLTKGGKVLDPTVLGHVLATAAFRQRAQNGFEGRMNKSQRGRVAHDTNVILDRMVDHPELASAFHDGIIRAREVHQNNTRGFVTEIARLRQFQERMADPLDRLDAGGIFAALTGRARVDLAKVETKEGTWQEKLKKELEKINSDFIAQFNKHFKTEGKTIQERLEREVREKGPKEAEARELLERFRAEYAAKLAEYLVRYRGLSERDACRGLACIINKGLGPVVAANAAVVFELARNKLRESCPNCAKGPVEITADALKIIAAMKKGLVEKQTHSKEDKKRSSDE